MSLQKSIKHLNNIAIAAVAFFAFITPTAFADTQSELAAEIQQQIAVLLLEEATAEITAIAPNTEKCRNSQITSYSPISGSVNNIVSEFQFFTSADTKISSLEAQVNGQDYPVQYIQLTDGSYRAKVVGLDTVVGNVYVTMGAQSESAGSCNDKLYTSFAVSVPVTSVVTAPATLKTTTKSTQSVSSENTNTVNNPIALADVEKEIVIENDSEDDMGVISTSTSVTADSKEESKKPGFWASLFDFSSWFGSNNAEVAVQEQQEASTTSPQVIATEDQATEEEVENATSTDQQVVLEVATDTEQQDPIEIATNGTTSDDLKTMQAASLFGLIDSSQERCMTVGSQWPWFVWLGVIWLWLIGVWVAISYYAEPVFGTKSYASRLTWIIVIAGLLGLLIWFVTNPCFTHAWLPATFIALSILLHWLYSEDAHIA